MKKTLFLAFLVVFAIASVIFSIRILSGEDDWICENGQWTKHGNPKSEKPSTLCGNVQEVQESIQESFDESKVPVKELGQKSESGNIIVTSPIANDEIKFPLVVRGSASVFENQFSIRLKEKSGRVLAEIPAYAYSADGEPGPFEEEIDYLSPKDSQGVLEVFDESMKDGSETDKVEIPVILPQIETIPVKIFVGSKKNDPKTLNCAKAYPIERRILKEPAVGKAVINELLKGISETEKMQGYFTNINEGVVFNNLTIENGVAKADFDEKLEEGVGGSCKVAAIRAQITQTLKQFPTVKSVVISINGRTEDILQP